MRTFRNDSDATPACVANVASTALCSPRGADALLRT
jgi:hypothetical protein